jgi:hypothetical protein
VTGGLLDVLAPELWQRILGPGPAGGSMARVARADNCRKCGVYIAYGLDDDVCAFEAFADVEPVTSLGEAQATLLGLRTYELRRTRDGFQIDHRHWAHIAGRPADATPLDVLAEHRCGQQLDRAEPNIRPRTTTTTEPPF